METAPSTADASGAPPLATEEKMRVMVAIDDSDESFYSLQWVLDNLFGSANENHLLTIIHVMEPFPHYVYPGVNVVFPTASVIQSVQKAQEEGASSILTQAVNMCAQKQVKAKTSILEGDPKEMICDVADQMHIDLIVVGSRGLGNIKRAFLGSVSDYVTHHAKCPVLVIKPPGSTALTHSDRKAD